MDDVMTSEGIMGSCDPALKMGSHGDFYSSW